MTEADWLRWEDSRDLVKLLCDSASKRKLRLFGCACCRQIDDLLVDDRSKQALELTERFIDGSASVPELESAHRLARAAMEMAWNAPAPRAVVRAVRAALTKIRPVEVSSGMENLQGELISVMSRATEAVASSQDARAKEHTRSQRALLRDIFGNPFRPVELAPAWLRWNDACVVKIAQSIYEDRRFDDMPILADALEDAGCDNEDILTHCRSEAPHARGCWVVDAILGKE